MAQTPDSHDPSLERLLAEEPFVRQLARDLVGDADEIAQETWLRVAERRGRVEQPRPWLRRVMRNVAANLSRRERRQLQRDTDAAVPDVVPSSAELMEREEQRRILVQEVDRLPPALRRVVLLRYFDGLKPREIAARLGVKPATVSTQLQRAREELRLRLDVAHCGDRRAWLLPVFGLGQDLSEAVGAGAAQGVIWMSAKTNLWGVGIACGAALVLFWQSREPRTHAASTSGADTGLTTAGSPESAAPAAAAQSDEERRQLPARVGVGSVRVQVLYPDAPRPAVGLPVHLRPKAGYYRFKVRQAVTDARGEVSFSGLEPGRYLVNSSHSRYLGLVVRAGKQAVKKIEIGNGIRVRGHVVDAQGHGIPGAAIEIAPLARADFDAMLVCRTDSEGRFDLRHVETHALIGARAADLAPSGLKFLNRGKGAELDLRFVLRDPGGAVVGRVVGPDGRALAGAVVLVGKGERTGIVASTSGADPLPALAWTDKEGRFSCEGIATGEQPLRVIAPGFAQLESSALVSAGGRVRVELKMSLGRRLFGRVHDREGKGIPGHTVSVWRDKGRLASVVSGADGDFEVPNLAAGMVEVRCSARSIDSWRKTVEVLEGRDLRCDFAIPERRSLLGQIEDQAGRPVAGMQIQATHIRVPGRFWHGRGRSDAEGRFDLPGFSGGGEVRIKIMGTKTHRGHQAVLATPIKAADLRFVVKRMAPPEARISGRVLGPDGQALTGIRIDLFPREGQPGTHVPRTDQEGRFATPLLHAGAWSLSIWPGGDLVRRVVDVRDLGVAEQRNLGELRFERGATLEVELVGAERIPEMGEVHMRLTGGPNTAYLSRHPPRRSEPLSPGRYRLLLNGKGVACYAEDVLLSAAEPHRLRVLLQPGFEQFIRLRLPKPNPKLKQRFHVEVQRAGERLALVYARHDPTTGIVELSLELPRGRSQLGFSFGGWKATTDLEVEGPQKKVVLLPLVRVPGK